jgi:hypothetical protein
MSLREERRGVQCAPFTVLGREATMLWWTAATSTRSNVTISFRCHARRLRVRSMASRMRPYARDQSTVLKSKPSVRNHTGNPRTNGLLAAGM